MIAAASSDGSSCVSLTISSGGRPARRAAPVSGPSSLNASIASRLLRSSSSENTDMAILLAELGEELGQVGRVLLLEEIDEVGSRTHAHGGA